MNSPTEGTTFLIMRLGFLVLMIGCISAFFLWAVRGGQFSHQDRARYLPLQSGTPAGGEAVEKGRQEWAGGDRHDA